jgi:hypothetical protein
MQNLYTRAFCRDCRLHFEYAVTDADLAEDPIVLCPLCERPAKHRPFQPCDQARYEHVEAQYERLADEAEERRMKKRTKSRQQDEGRDRDEDYPADRKRRKRSR